MTRMMLLRQTERKPTRLTPMMKPRRQLELLQSSQLLAQS